MGCMCKERSQKSVMLQEYYIKNKEHSLCPQLQRERVGGGEGKYLDPKLHMAKKTFDSL